MASGNQGGEETTVHIDEKIKFVKKLNDNERLNQVGLGVLGIGTAATLAATFALAQQ